MSNKIKIITIALAFIIIITAVAFSVMLRSEQSEFAYEQEVFRIKVLSEHERQIVIRADADIIVETTISPGGAFTTDKIPYSATTNYSVHVVGIGGIILDGIVPDKINIVDVDKLLKEQ